MKIQIGFALSLLAVALLIGLRAPDNPVKESETAFENVAPSVRARVTLPIPPGANQVDEVSAHVNHRPAEASESLEEVLRTIAHLEDAMERSGLMNKARTQSLSDEEGQELAEMINEVLALRDRELSLRMEKLNARLNQSGSAR